MPILRGDMPPLHDILSNSNSGGVSVPGLPNSRDATSLGGGFLIGLAAQEETIVWSIYTLPFFMTDTAQYF